MSYSTLISVDALARQLDMGEPLVLLDCGFDLGDPAAGKRAYDEAHIPGAHYVHLEDTLSGPVTGSNGRHPLPDRAAFSRAMAGLGVGDGIQVVAYDNAGGMYAARLWWLMRWLGHGTVAVLDGGVAAWKRHGKPLVAEPTPQPARPGSLAMGEPLTRTVSHDDLRANLGTGALLVIDARAPDRFRGENETLDPIGGHIPGARNHFFRGNLAEDGRFRSPEELRGALAASFAGHRADAVVSQCGSGVTACHNLLAMKVAGLPEAPLYPGSWSEWCAQPGAPVATGH